MEPPSIAKLLLGRSKETPSSSRGLTHPKLARLPSRRRVFPVIHLKSVEQVLENTKLAHSLDCDGVFLINHGNSSALLLDAFKQARDAYPDFFIGLNILTEWVRSILRHVLRKVLRLIFGVF
jgi:hypothetical protein